MWSVEIKELEILEKAWDKRFTYNHHHYLVLQEVRQALAAQDR